MCLTLPETLITVVGIEKLIPTWRDLEVFLQLLPRSSTGERMNPYTSMWTGVTPGDGPQDIQWSCSTTAERERSPTSRPPGARGASAASACLNVCPVYERTGGHAYGAVYPGPIGAILTPLLAGVEHATPAAVRLVACAARATSVPGGDRHPDRAGQASPRRGEGRAPPSPGRDVRGGGAGDERPAALDAGAEARAAVALHQAWRSPAAVPVDPHEGPSRSAARVVPRLVDQATPMSARDEVLARVRSAIAPVSQDTREIPRDYRATTEDGVEAFLERLAHYDARAIHTTPDALDETVRATLTAPRSQHRRARWRPGGMADRINPLHDNPRSTTTPWTAPTAWSRRARWRSPTGTIVLDGGPGMGRRALTLLPTTTCASSGPSRS